MKRSMAVSPHNNRRVVAVAEELAEAFRKRAKSGRTFVEEANSRKPDMKRMSTLRPAMIVVLKVRKTIVRGNGR